MSAHKYLHHAIHGFKGASHHDGGKGALYGAAAVAGTVATGAALAGMALTPLGLAVTLGAGAIAGGTGGIKKTGDALRRVLPKV